MPNESYNDFTFFGPKPGIPTISINPGGTLSYSDCISPQVPCITDSVIRPPIPFPIPFTCNNLPSEIVENKSSSIEDRALEAF